MVFARGAGPGREASSDTRNDSITEESRQKLFQRGLAGVAEDINSQITAHALLFEVELRYWELCCLLLFVNKHVDASKIDTFLQKQDKSRFMEHDIIKKIRV